jgi:hypothetical protein
MSKQYSIDIYPLVLAVLEERCGGRCLDTEEERKEVAAAVAGALAHPGGFFPITSIHRDDLQFLGSDVSQVDDAMMELLARSLEDVYVQHSFWPGLELLAVDLRITRKTSGV